MIFKYLLGSLMFFSMIAPLAPANAETTAKTATAILAGGCFWCLETDFDKLEGVTGTTSGYSGGTIPNPTYENYHDKIKGFDPHVEVVKVDYNPDIISYAEILNYHLRHIDPTDNGGQFCDRGAAYRPVIYIQNEDENKIAQIEIKKAADELGQEVKVDILPATEFWAAEDYHQDYASKSPIRYKFYRWNCGRDKRVDALWGSNNAQGKNPYNN